MDAVLLSRIQFAMTIGFHFIFAPLTIGLACLIVVLMARYRRSGNEDDSVIARFWVRLFALTVVVGVATGITMEFQFGTNWAQYSRFVGDIFGAPLAAEALSAFFLESVFIGVLLFGWNRISRNALFVSSVAVAVGAILSAFWIIVANSWMQTPAGFTVRHGRAELTSFTEAVFNPSTMQRFLHTVDGALMTGAFFMLGISAWFLLKNRHVGASRRTFTLALTVATITSLLQLGFGHFHAVQVAATQPAKLAAFEGLFQTQPNSPLLVFGIPDPARETVDYAIRIPGGLSFLLANNRNAKVVGLEAFPQSAWPNVRFVHWSFDLMVAAGMAMLVLAVWAGCLGWKSRRLAGHPWLLRALVAAGPLGFVAIETGWVVTEVGRQPWIIYGVMRTEAAVTPMPGLVVPFVVFTALYVFLAFVVFFVLRRQFLAPAATSSATPTT